MYRSRLSLSLLAVVVVASGCSETTPVAPDVVEDAPPLVNAPALSQGDLLTTESVVEIPDVPDGPALEITDWELEDEEMRPIQQIFNAGTRVGYGDGFASSIGDHRYIGNVGSVSTTAHVTYKGQHVGSHTAKRQKYMPFIADWGMVKKIEVAAKVYTDHACGLTVSGESEHRAWWQFYQGSGVAEWGVEVRTTQARPRSQGDCTDSTGTRRAEEPRSAGVVCTYLITYDLETGVIVSAELLYCSSTGGTLI